MSNVYFDLSSGDFLQDWTDTGLITTNDDWSGVPSIIGYLGDDPATTAAITDAQAVTRDGLSVDVVANATNPNTNTSGGVAEFEIDNPTVALQGSGTADFPNLVLHLNATGRSNVTLSFNARDIDGSADNAVQQVAVQYRLGGTGAWTNLPAGYVADATTQNSATQVTPVSVTLPDAVNGAADLQVRILTANAVGSDEWVGIDDIRVTSQSDQVQLLSEDFSDFTAAGFTAEPAAGQLDSDVWRVAGLSDNANPAFGGDYTSADFARGIINGAADPFTAGVYSPSANGALVVQPTGAEFDVGGFIETRIVNTSGSALTSFNIDFDWAFRNSGARSDLLALSYSTDGTNFTTIDSAAFATPAVADAPVSATFSTQNVQATLADLVVADGGSLYLRWIHTGSTGGGNRDEVGIDNVNVTASRSSIVTARVDSITLAEGNEGQTAATFTVTRSSGTGIATVNYATANGTATAGVDYVAAAGTLTFADGETTKTVSVQVNGDTLYEPNETFFLDLSNPVGLTIPSARGVATITNDDSGPISIMQIQGEAHRSAYAGLAVQTSGIVTAVDTNGFYLQDPTGDGNNRTSDAIFVFTSSAPTVTIGDAVDVSGNVSEFGSGLPVTQIVSPTISVTSQNNALPEAVLIGVGGRVPPSETIDDDRLQSFDPDTDGADFFESLEGMRVTIDRPMVVANTSVTTSGTNTFVETDVVASLGQGATGVNSRGGITISPTDNPASPVDYNPERIQIDTSRAALGGDNSGRFSVGDQLASVTGILNYAANRYEVLATQAITVTKDVTLERETTTLAGDGNHLSLATYNMENLDASDGKYDVLAGDIVYNLGAPDIIAAQEIQDADGAGTGADTSGVPTANGLIAALSMLGKNYAYVEIAPAANTTGGEPGGNIRNGYFYNTDRVSYVTGSASLIDTAAYAGTRRPLVAQWEFNGETLTTINVHFTSRGGSDALYGANQPPADAGSAAREAQALGVKAYINNALASDPTLNIAVLGDFNGFYFEQAQQQLTDPAQGGVLTNLAVANLPEEERYSYLFEGNNQLIDNILVTGSLAVGSSYDAVHINSQFGGERPTDHDPQLALLRLGDAVTPPQPASVKDDFNGDGRSDILWRNDGGTLSSWLATASGGFTDNRAAAAAVVALGWKIAGTGDFNGDGRGDILWRNVDGRLVDWLGSPNGGFVDNAAASLTSVATDWRVVGTGDFDGDGRSDVLWRNDDGRLSNWLGTAAGGFSDNGGNASAHVATSWQVAGTGDFDGDGRSDILWRNVSGQLSQWLGTAGGGFADNGGIVSQVVSADWQIQGTGDFNGDGKADILWRNASGQLSQWLGMQNGGFSDNGAIVRDIVSLDWQVASTGDYNGDGRSDILWTNVDGRLSDWLGGTNGSFTDNGGNVTQTVRSGYDAVAVADFNGDGRADVLWNNDLGAVTGSLSSASGRLVDNEANALTVVEAGWSVAGAGDFNGDGRGDILWRNTDGRLTNWVGSASGGLVDNSANAAATVATSWHVVGTGDFNGDGRDDILWRNDNGALSSWLGSATGAFADNGQIAGSQVATSWKVAATGDFNGDGKDDILWRNDSGQLSEWLGTANGGFADNGGRVHDIVSQAWQVAGTGDINGDGRDDIVWRNASGQLSEWLGTTNGSFADNGSSVSQVVGLDWRIDGIGDVNGDGRDDILWHNDSGQLSNWLGTQSGAFFDNGANASTWTPLDWHVQGASSAH